MSESLVICQKVSKVFKDFWMRDRVQAVHSLSFEIQPREVFGLLGPNGSGKSTAIKMILGLLRPTSGRIALFNKPPSDVATKRRIGYLPEESYLYGFLNARETLEYYGKLFELDYRTRAKRVDELLDMLGLTNAQFRPVREYSKGMQRRIGIAQALINDPDLLILDEPTTGLDPIGTKQIKELIIELGRRGKTVLLSSHLLADVEDCVDRLIILYGGQKRAEGTCDDLLVTQSKTTIEADTLDEQTVAEIDRLIRVRSQGMQAITKVSKPRQSLEALFLDIVERAKSEITTSGAIAGGQTASFLKGEDDEGDALIDKLVAGGGRGDAQPQAAPDHAAALTKRLSGPDDDVIGSLVNPDAAISDASPVLSSPATTTSTSAADVSESPSRTGTGKPAGQSVDESIIGNLLGGDSSDGGKR